MKKLITLSMIVGWMFLLSMLAFRKDPPAVQPPFTPNESKPPVAMAGAPQQVNLQSCQSRNGAADLDGSGSFDPDGKIMSYSWAFIFGPQPPTLKDASSAKARVEDLTVGTYGFELTVKDDKNLASKDTILINVFSNPSGYDLDITLQAPYQLKDSVADCVYFYYCNYFFNTVIEGKVQHPVLGTLDIHISENAITGSYHDIRKTVIQIYKGNINDQFISGTTDFAFHQNIRQGNQNFSGEIILNHGSAFNCDQFFFLRNQVRLSFSGSVNRSTEIITLHLRGKLYF